MRRKAESAFAYTLTFPNGEMYFGSTSDIVMRAKEHIQTLESGKHQNVNMQKLYDAGHRFKLSFERFHTREQAYEREQKLLTDHAEVLGLLNIGRHVFGGDNLTLHPNREEIIARRTETQLAVCAAMTPEERAERWSQPGEKNGMYGRTHTDEAKANIGRLLKGNKYALGAVRTPEQRAKISVAASERTGVKNSFFGKQHTAETKEKLAAKRRGSLPTNANAIEIDGVVYLSQSKAAAALGVSPMTITFRLKSSNDKFSGYRIIEQAA